MIKSLLIANRGEIACRIIATARKMGVRTIAVYSDADAKAMHVRQADVAVHIGPSPAAESYLVGEKIIAAAKQSGADAIHPGYGFLSENADFAQAVIDAGLVWVGPKPDSIRAMGLKDAAKKLMDDAGVPTTPGYMGDNQDPEYLAKQADKIGYPVLIKAVAGGGGKGMRKVDAAEDFADRLASCQREAQASFGNDIVLIEKWITNPRHIEVQVFGDSHGNVVHLFERDCSLQRRHQKVVEEAPAPDMDETTRAALCDAAVRAAKAVDYEGAGTIEFIADASEGLRADRIWFMEMNTRLQVEHPVTEEITGVDLVEWQLRVASGEAMPLEQTDLSISGHAVEVRLYAEDPTSGFLPSTGMLAQCHFPDDGVRIETGVEQGDAVSPFYDPMIAKVIVHAGNRDDALMAIAEKLEGLAVWPVKSNAGFLFNAVTHPAFIAGDITTSFIEDHGESLLPIDEPSEEMLRQAAKELVFQYQDSHRAGLSGLRLNANPSDIVRMSVGGKSYQANAPAEFGGDIYVSRAARDVALVTANGQSFGIALERHEGGATAGAADGAILSPMPGKVIALDVQTGDMVVAGQKLMVLEAMKMEHSIVAPFDGIVREVGPALNEQVASDALLIQIEKPQSEAETK
jgi:3-methylcrotonyl-CoA carboxylase alpha subunit